MEQSEILNKVLKLEDLLIKELRQEGLPDALGRWMAYYIAEKMNVSQTRNAEQKAAAEKACMETIPAVWKHHWEFQPESRPLYRFREKGFSAFLTDLKR